MTAQEVIATIRAEIERRIMYHRNLADTAAEKNLHNTMESNDLLVHQYGTLLPFLSTLESEKPMQDGLEEEIGSYMSNKWKFGCIIPITPVVLPNFTTEDLKECAHNFAQWGAEHASGSSEIPNDLEEAAKHHSEQYRPHWPNQVRPAYDSFIAGAKWQAEQLLKSSPLPEDTVLFNKGVEEGKRLMMEEAVECETVCIKDRLAAILPMKEFQWTVGEKVRVIVLKKED